MMMIFCVRPLFVRRMGLQPARKIWDHRPLSATPPHGSCNQSGSLLVKILLILYLIHPVPHLKILTVDMSIPRLGLLLEECCPKFLDVLQAQVLRAPLALSRNSLRRRRSPTPSSARKARWGGAGAAMEVGDLPT